MTTPDTLWILSVPARSLAECERLAPRLEELAASPPVELETPGQSILWLEVYFEDEVPARLAAQVLRGEFPQCTPEIRPCPHQDWTTFWRHHFHPRPIGKHLLILPEWLRDEAQHHGNREVVLINPGLSFGTGDHFTTRFCLEMIDRLHDEPLPKGPMLDAGCGSAILSIAARKLGWTSILAIDNDPQAVGQAAENLALNGVTDGIDLRVMDLTREWPDSTYPLVVANLYGGLLMDLAPRLLATCSHTLLLSGIRVVEAEAVSATFSELGAKEIASDADHEWCGFRFEK
jgi:ribosomal protein L11 methyltransferase